MNTLVIGSWLLVLAFISALTLVICYGVMTRWEHYPVGRQFMFTKVMFVVVLGLGSANFIIDIPAAMLGWFRIAIYGWITAAMIIWIIILFKAQRKGAGRAQSQSQSTQREMTS